MKYKVKNPLEQKVKCGNLTFEPKEIKVLDYIPGLGFHVEEIEELEQPKKITKGGK